MKKVLGYLKTYIPSLILAVLLICGTVICDLSLPNLMSNIVSIGIQQGGVENASPSAISEEGYQLIHLFASEADQAVLDQAYTLHSADPSDPEAKEVPLLATEPVYLLNDSGKQNRTQLDQIFSRSIMTLYLMAKSSMGSSGSTTTDTSSTSLDLQQIYTMLPMLSQIPSSTIAETRDSINDSQSLLEDSLGIAMAKSFDQEVGIDIGALQMSYIIWNGLLMLLLTLGSVLASILTAFLSSRIAAGVARNLRRDVFHKVTSFHNEEFDRFSTASLITRTTNDITQVQMLFSMGIVMLLKAPLTGAGGIIMALGKSVSLGWIIALSVLVLMGLILLVMVIAMPKFIILQKLVDRVNLVSRENLNGIMVIRAFNNEDFEQKRYDKANLDLSKTQLFVNRVMVTMMPAMMLIMNLSSMLIIWVGAHQVAESTMQIGDMMAFMQYSMQIIIAFLLIAMMFILVPRAAVSSRRIAEVLNTGLSIQEPREPKSFDESKRGLVEFRDVSFRYNHASDDVLEHITFTAEPGKTTAFIGSTGSGKSALLNLIPRFYDCTGGQILIGGVDIRDLPTKTLRDAIGYVPQKGILHKGTIGSNIGYGKADATPEEIHTAAEVAQAMDFISQKEQGMDSEISAGGTNVSGGQKQRISIARALVRKPDVYLFDDSFSALDFKTDAALRHALQDYTGNATVLIVAQRVGTIRHADQILVLDEGKIVGKGTHEELLKTCPVYYEIASSQLTKEELA